MSSSNVEGVENLSHVIASMSIDPDAASYSDLVTIRQTGSAGMAVFASRDIPRGTRIAAETPLIMIPPGPDEESPARFCKALLMTTAEDLARIDRHHCDPLTLQTITTTAIGAEIQRWTEANLPALTSSSSSSSSNSETHCATSSPKSLEEITQQTCRRYAIFLTNNLDTGGASEPALELDLELERGGGGGGRGLFHLFSRMNHSCAPNVFDHYNAELGRLTSHATRDVAAGEELCSHYIDVLVPRRMRRRKLRAWGFVCRCSACADDELEAMRERAIELDDMVEEYADYYFRDGNELDNDTGGVEREKDGERGDKPVLTTASEALEACRELVQLLQTQGLHGLELFNAYRFCSKFSFERGDIDKAREYARLALDVEHCCVGRDATLADDLWEDTNRWIESLGNI